MLYEIFHGITYYWWWFAADPEFRKNLSNFYIERFIKFDNSYIEKIGTWKSISILNKWIDAWASGLTRFIWNGSWLIASFIIVFFYLSRIHYSASFIFITIFLLSLYFSHQMNTRMIRIRTKRNEQEHMHSKYLVKLIMSKLEVMQWDKIKQEQGSLSAYMDRAKGYNIQMSPYFHSFFHGPYFFIVILKLIFLYIISFSVFDWNIGIAEFVWIFAVMLMLESTVMNFIDFFKNFSKEYSMIEYLWNFFDTAPQIQWYEEWWDFIHKNGKISIKDISYWYEASKPIFQNFDLEILGNKVTALVGPSWGGKSTLVKLISGYVRQDSWKIMVDDQNLKDVSLKSYYKDVWYLTQEPSVFDGTIIENLLYAVPGWVNDTDIKETITLAHCEFIYDLPNWLETEIGERWVKLSGWQKQRLAIAKIFLKNPKIIILDEPTSALDSLSEKKITEAMHNLFKNRTVIVIAHRLQTVKHADDIIVIEAWTIRERWTHSELIKKKWFYKQMLDLQSWF